MTNAEKYLKDAEALMELPSRLRDYIDSKQLGYVTATMITDFFVADAKPQLTDDEKAILRNINTEIGDLIQMATDTNLLVTTMEIIRLGKSGI